MRRSKRYLIILLFLSPWTLQSPPLTLISLCFAPNIQEEALSWVLAISFPHFHSWWSSTKLITGYSGFFSFLFTACFVFVFEVQVECKVRCVLFAAWRIGTMIVTINFLVITPISSFFLRNNPLYYHNCYLFKLLISFLHNFMLLFEFLVFLL